MKSYTFKLSKLAFAGCIVGILLGIGGIAFTIYRMLAPSLGFSSPQLIIQHIVIIIASLLALVIFPAILIHSVYKVTDKEIILWFGIIKSTFLLKDIKSVHLFTKTNKLVVYFKDDRYTVIVVKPEWYNEFVKDICNANKDIRYDDSTPDSDDSDDFSA